MKNLYKFAGMIVLVSMVISSPAVSDTGVRLNVGLSNIAYGDFNDVVDLSNENSAVFGEIENISWVPEIGGEIFYSPMPMFSVGVGVGMIKGSSDLSSVILGDFEHKINVYPMTVTAYFKPSLPLMPIKPYAYAGTGMYYSKLSFDYSGFRQDVFQITDAELTKLGFGFHAGGGLEFSIVPMLSLQIGVQGRWAKIKGFEGTGTDQIGRASCRERV